MLIQGGFGSLKDVKTPENLGYPLELSADELEQLVAAAMARLKPFINTLSQQPVDTSTQLNPLMLKKIKESLPIVGKNIALVLDELFEEALPHSLNPASPGFMGYVPGGGLLHAGVADLIADTLNRFVGASPVAPGFNQIEANVVRWFIEMVGMPASAGGFLTSGGSLANQAALAIARTVQLGERFDNATVYLSDQAHNCLDKAARVCGFPRANIRIINSDHRFRMSVTHLQQSIEQDRANKKQPFLVVASAGTTNTGAVDPLRSIAQLCADQQLWFHVDAAYGGFFCLTERGNKSLAGMAKADTLVLDPHKTLFLPYGTGALLVRNRAWLKQTYASPADYLPDSPIDDDIMDFRDISPELTRPFRGLRVWLPLKIHGAETFRAYLDEKLDLAQLLAKRIEAIPELSILASPELSILAFALCADSSISGSDQLRIRNDLNRQLLKLINFKNRVHLTGTMLNGVFALRIAVVVFRTHQQHIDVLMEDLETSLQELNKQIHE